MTEQTEPKPDESNEPQSESKASEPTAKGPPKTGDSQSKGSNDWIAYVVVGGIVALVVCNWIGWATVFTILLWGVVVIAALAAVGLGAYAVYAEEDDEKTGAWIGVGVSVVIAFAAWIFVPDGGGTDGSIANSTDAETGLTPEQVKARRTLAYWGGLRGALARTNAIEAQDAQQVLNILYSAIGEIDSTPAAGVDVDAIRCGSAWRKWLAMVAAEAERRDSPELLVEAFARGYGGDVFGPLLEIGQANAAIQRSLVELQDQSATTRAMLSARYDVEFPPL